MQRQAFLLKNKWLTDSKWEIILEFLYFMTELVLHAQEPTRAAPWPIQGVSVSCYGIRRHSVYRNTAIGFLTVCDGPQ